MATIIFDSKNKKEYFSKYDINFLTFESIKEFNCYGQHETLISIISNAQKIADEIDSIIDKIIKEYPNTTHFIFFDTSILNSFLFLFDNLDSKIGNYAETEFKEIESLMNKTNEFISKNKQEIEEYEYALKNSIVVEEDKYLFIVNIEDKFHNTFPKHIFNIYKRMEKLEPYKTREEKEIMEKENKIYYEYILNTYSKEYKKFASDVVKNYLEEIKERQKFLNGELKYFKQYKKDIKTCYFDSFLSFLRRIKNIVLYIEYQVKALNCIEYENETFNWGNITKEERLCLANIYANPLKVDIELPKSKILYAIKEN
jgi:hypothetical protein